MSELTNISNIKKIMSENGFTFSKSLGQNFIINPGICPKIAELGMDEGSSVIEIGTGIGVLTKELAKRAKKVVGIELDTRLLPILERTLSEFDNIKIINEDVLKTDLHKLIAEEFGNEKVFICANLPYYITSPIIMKLLEEKLPIQAITVMVQREAADRICAALGTRQAGAVTAAVRYYSEPKKLFDVSKGSFMPAPNVDSAVIRLDVCSDVKLDEKTEKMFFRIVKSAFGQRRKTLLNSLSAGLGVDKEVLSKAFINVDISAFARAEQLTMDMFTALAKELV